jgi:hypothetical protein
MGILHCRERLDFNHRPAAKHKRLGGENGALLHVPGLLSLHSDRTFLYTIAFSASDNGVLA